MPGFAAREDVVLKRVHHLVREHVLEALQVPGEVEEHAVTRRFGDAAGAFTEIAGDVVLPEVGARREEHDRLLLAKLMVEDPGQARVRPLRHARRVIRRGGFLGVVINDEVFGLELRPLEPVVLHLILTEIILGACRRASGHEKREARDESQTPAPQRRHAPIPAPRSSGTSSASAHRRSS